MARLNTFYLAPEAWPENGRASLGGPEAHHLTRVLRHKVGDHVRLFDGHGRDGLFQVVSLTKKNVQLELETTETHAPSISPLTLALGWNKSTRRDWIIEKSVELGVSELHFWQSLHSQGKVPLEPKARWIDRTIQAAKQCGASWLPTMSTHKSLDLLIQQGAHYNQKLLLWEDSQATQFLTPALLAQGKTLAVVGPEGGISEAESALLIENGFTPVTLGASVLRWETAALVCMSLAFHARQPG